MKEFGCQSMIGKLLKVLLKHPKDAFIGQEHLNKHWQSFHYSSCPDFEKALEEYNEFENLLKKYVPKIEYLPYDNAAGLDSIYTHDPVKVTNEGAIILSMGSSRRRMEPFVMKGVMTKIQIPILGSIEGRGKVEGGDLLWLDEQTLAIGRGYRTNDDGIKQVKEITTEIVDDYVIAQLPHGEGPDACLHLMSLISFLDKDLALVYSKYLSVPFRELLYERGIELLEVPEEEYTTLGSNVLTLAPKLCIALEGNRKTNQLLEEAGVRVSKYKGEEISIKGTGGPTCLTCAIVRL